MLPSTTVILISRLKLRERVPSGPVIVRLSPSCLTSTFSGIIIGFLARRLMFVIYSEFFELPNSEKQFSSHLVLLGLFVGHNTSRGRQYCNPQTVANRF